MVKFSFTTLELEGLVIALVLYIGIAIGCAEVMSRKGRSGALGFVLLIFLNVVGLVIVLLYPPVDVHRKPKAGKVVNTADWRPNPHQYANVPVGDELQPCRFCGSRVPRGSRVCRVCHVELGTPHAIPWGPPEPE
jgi:hypothetical protein